MMDSPTAADRAPTWWDSPNPAERPGSAVPHLRLQLGNGWLPGRYEILTVPPLASVMCDTCSFMFDPGGILIRQGDPHMTSPRIPQNFERPIARRGLLKGMGAAAAFATVPGALAACS